MYHAPISNSTPHIKTKCTFKTLTHFPWPFKNKTKNLIVPCRAHLVNRPRHAKPSRRSSYYPACHRPITALYHTIATTATNNQNLSAFEMWKPKHRCLALPR
jgi:hypothetical protein